MTLYSRHFENRKSGDEYQALSDAAYARSYADWIIGMNGSRVATRLPQSRDRSANSLGRVQTATLALVVDHELEILSHVPVPFWQLNATFSAGDARWKARWERTGHKDDPDRPEHKAHRITEADEKASIEEALAQKGPFSTAETTRTKKKNHPSITTLPPFKSVQTACGRGLQSEHWGLRKTCMTNSNSQPTRERTRNTCPKTCTRPLRKPSSN